MILNSSPLIRQTFFALFCAVWLGVTPSCSGGRTVQSSPQISEDGEEELPFRQDRTRKPKTDQAQLEMDFIEGVRARQLGDPALAEARFQDVLRADPGNAAACFELARLRFEAGDIARAIALAQRSTELEPGNPYFLELYGDMLTLTNQFEKATGAFRKLTELNPENPEPYFQLAYTYLQSGQAQDALKVYDQVETRFGAEPSLLLEKYRIHVQLGKLDDAALVLEKLIEIDPDDPQYYELLARIYEGANQPDRAAMVYEKLLSLEVGSPTLVLKAALIYLNRKDYTRFRERSQQAFDASQVPLDAKVAFLLPWIDSLGSDFSSRDFVFDLCERMVRTHSSDPKAHALSGDFFFHDKKLEEARASYLNSLMVEQSIFDVWRQVFAIDLEMRNDDSLMAVSSRAADIFPNQPSPFYFNGYANLRLKNYDAAVRSLRRALPMSMGNPQLRAEIFSLLGDAYHSLEDHVNSDESYESSLALMPDNPYVLNNYSYYLSLRKENLERAAEMAAKANELSPDNASFQDTYAWVLYQQGRYEQAKVWQEKALSNGGESSAVQQEHYGDILFRLGAEERAVQAWQKARELGTVSEALERKISDRRLYE